MQLGVITVGTTPVPMSVATVPLLVYGMRFSAASNGGNISVGIGTAAAPPAGFAVGAASNVVPSGAPGTTPPYTVTPDVFARAGVVWLVSDTPGQLVDWNVA